MKSEELREKIAGKLCYLAGATTPFEKLPKEVQKDWFIDADAILAIVREAVSATLPKIEQPGKGWAGANDAGRNRGIVECRDALMEALS